MEPLHDFFPHPHSAEEEEQDEPDEGEEELGGTAHKRNQGHRDWCMTVQRCTPRDMTKLRGALQQHTAYALLSLSTETSTVMCFAHFKTAKTWTAVQKLLSRKAKRLPTDLDHCRQFSTHLEEFGVLPHRGRRKKEPEEEEEEGGEEPIPRSPPPPPALVCMHCNKAYLSRTGLWKHRQKCVAPHLAMALTTTKEEQAEAEDREPTMALVTSLIQNQSRIIEQQQLWLDTQQKQQFHLLEQQQHTLMELAKSCLLNPATLQNNHNSYNMHHNSHNKTFNLQFFLNETCKNAMNINDFVDSIQLDLSDLERVGEVGYVEGISDIIIKNLKALDVSERPIHCTDKKREIFYVKDANKWEKDDAEKNNIRKVIKRVANKNIRLLPKFKEAHPDCGRSDSRYSDQYNRMIVESLDMNDAEKEKKIIRNISRQVSVPSGSG